jgi:hypothetical protein
MKGEKNVKNKEIFLKIREYNSNNKLTTKKRIEFSSLFYYDKIYKLVNESMKNHLEKLGIKIVEFQHLLFLINHPQIKEIYIYSEEQWNFYLNYNLIIECIENNTLKIEYYLITDNNLKTIKEEFRNNKKNVIKHIIRNISLKFFLETFLKFFDKNAEFAKEFKSFFISELFNNQSENKTPINNNTEESIEDNINIDNLISSQNFLIEENKKSQINQKIIKDYYLHKSELFDLFEKQFKDYCKYQNSFVEIKDLFENDEKQIDIDKSKNINKTNLNLNKNNDNLVDISLFESTNDNYNEDNALFTQLIINDSRKYVKELMNDNLFKIIDEKEYYKGIEYLKDDLNMKLYKLINKNDKKS